MKPPAEWLNYEQDANDHRGALLIVDSVVDYADAALVYNLGDIFISPTYAEGFSNTILEAMASGLPIVSTNTVGVIDCITDKVNGSLIEPGDIDAQARAIQHLIDDKTYRLRITQQAYDDVIQHYSWPVIAKQIETRYQRLQYQTIDSQWTKLFNIKQSLDDTDHHIDLNCRFRYQPHLL